MPNELTAHLSRLERRRRRKQREKLYAQLKKDNTFYGFVVEPFLSPFHHINLIFQELGARLVTQEEAAQVIQEVILKYTTQVSPPKLRRRTDSRRQKTAKIKSESVLTASQLSITQYEEQDQTLQGNGLLLDAIEMLCATRNLEVRRQWKHRFSFERNDIPARCTALLFVDKCEPYFVSCVSLPESHLWSAPPPMRDLHPSKENGFVQVTSCFPYPFQWRTLSFKKMPKPSGKHCLCALVCKTENALSFAPSSCAASSDVNRRMRVKREREEDESSTGSNSEEHSVSSDHSFKEKEEPSSDVALTQRQHDDAALSYPTTPYPRERLFTLKDNMDDPFIRLPRGYSSKDAMQEKWHEMVFKQCGGKASMKKKFFDEIHASANADTYNQKEEDPYYFL